MIQSNISENIKNIKLKINEICQKLNRNPHEIKLIAVSKFQPAEKIEEAYHYGIRDFGENYIQEWQKKATELSHLKDIRWHLIGKLQSNKVKYLNKNVYCLQSLDSLSLAKEIEKKFCGKTPLNVLVQLQVDASDINKSGIPCDEAHELCEFIMNSSHLKLCGFMGIGPDEASFQKLKLLYASFIKKCGELSLSSPGLTRGSSGTISLGMSQDMGVALECGSTMVRIGTAIFGARTINSQTLVK